MTPLHPNILRPRMSNYKDTTLLTEINSSPSERDYTEVMLPETGTCRRPPGSGRIETRDDFIYKITFLG